MLNLFLIELSSKKFWPPARARRNGGVGGIPPRPSVRFRSCRAKRGNQSILFKKCSSRVV